MFSPSLGRVVRSTGAISTPAMGTLGRVAATPQTLVRPSGHQRRLSSSKPSIPPNGAKGPVSEQQTAGAGTSKVAARKVTGRTSKKKTPPTPALNVPHVPPTNHLEKSQVKLSSFFSLHRPISVTSAIPPVCNTATFDAIFQPRPSRRAMMENIQTMSGGIETLEDAMRAHEAKQYGASEDVVHLDGAPQMSLDQYMSRLVPFSPPPAPLPAGEEAEAEAVFEEQTDVSVAPVKQRSWSTAVVVTESVDAAGNRTYSTSTTPMREIQVPAAENGQEMNEIEIQQPFLERMRQRQNTRYRENQMHPGMLAISVKRQRKLKMKKHKYKKLMKRTRLLRRKLDRL